MQRYQALQNIIEQTGDTVLKAGGRTQAANEQTAHRALHIYLHTARECVHQVYEHASVHGACAPQGRYTDATGQAKRFESGEGRGRVRAMQHALNGTRRVRRSAANTTGTGGPNGGLRVS